jgi:DHA2 family multidrug resistance protein
VLAPVGILAILLSPVVGRLVGRVDPRLIASVGFLVFVLVSYLRSRFNAQVDMGTLMVPTVLQGAAVACFFIPLTTITLSGLAHQRIASASGVANFARITAGAFGTSIATTVWDDRATMHHARLVEHLDAGNVAGAQALSALQASGLDSAEALALLDRLVNVQAYVLSADDIYWVSMLMFMALVPMVWLAKASKAGVIDAGGAH